MNAYLRLMRFDKPIGIYLLLYPALWALFLAQNGVPRWELLVIFILGVVLMRASGCVINDYADRHIDGLVARTKNRPLVGGEISPKNALKLFVGLMILAFCLVLLTHQLSILLALCAGVLASIYPFTKRWIQLPQLVLGLAFAMSVPMAFAATNGSVPSAAAWVFGATVVWTLIYDTMYAMADRAEDLQIGVKSSAVWFGRFDVWVIGALQLVLFGLLVQIALVFALGVFYVLALAVVAILMGYHQFLIKNRVPKLCFKAFLHNHWIGLAVFVGIALSVIFPTVTFSATTFL